MNLSRNLREIRKRRGAGAEVVNALDRDARMPRLLDGPLEAGDLGACVRALDVVVVGLGSIGSYLADLLARTTVASLRLVDRDRVSGTSVLTHPVQPRDIGRPKATLAGERAKAVSPSTRVAVSDGPVESLGLEAFVGASAVLLASDNLLCEQEVSRRCLQLGLPLIQVSLHGPTLVAEVRSLAGAAPGDAPCLACGYQAADWEALDAGTVYSCTGGPARRSGVPTVSPASLCSTAASLGVNELLARCAGLVPAPASRQITYCGFQHRTTVTPLERRAECPADHRPWRVEAWQRPLATATPGELFAAAGCPTPADLAAASLTVEGFRFGRMGACACPDHPALGRFLPTDHAPAPCPACGFPLEPHPFYTHEVVPGGALEGHLDTPLNTLGADSPGSVLVRRADEAVLFHARERGPSR